MVGRKFVLFDIDGTLADNTHRQHFLMSSPKQWVEFFDAMDGDKPNLAIVALYNVLYRSGSYELVVITGRPEKYRSDTENWLTKYGIELKTLLMRRDGDYRRDAETKREMIDEITQSLDEIELIVDDRAQTVRMWRDLGVTCLQCADHDH